MPLSTSQLASDRYPLVNRFYRQHQRGTKANSQHLVWVGEEHGQIVCSLCLQPVSNGHWLTSLLVAPQSRTRGYATSLLAQIRNQYTGPIWLFCAPELSAFYLRAGFAEATVLPESLVDRLTRYQRHMQLVALASE